VEVRQRAGHWEAPATVSAFSKYCAATLAERKTGLVLIGKLKDRTARSLSRRAMSLMRKHTGRFETVARAIIQISFLNAASEIAQGN
jgi:IS30 family transposase